MEKNSTYSSDNAGVRFQSLPSIKMGPSITTISIRNLSRQQCWTLTAKKIHK